MVLLHWLLRFIHVAEVYPYCGTCQYIISFYSYIIFHHLYVLLFFLSVDEFWVISSLAIVNSAVMNILVQVLCEHIFLFLVSILQGVAGCGREQASAPAILP